ncbi:Protein eyes shut like protein [Chelonia mydas]|uniref:Protein eyes shut like protein n=1 Tax=Chelonia mydas TaxID=8469 RepID=M7BCT5_CHEMY|nr:Protein eyes shut like protein [Chelonia mydas]
MHQVDPRWLGVGTHYFAEVQTKGPPLCNLGLRLNVTVKQQFCQQSSNEPFCSRHGRCLSHVWEEAYNCHCSQQYSGRFCEEFDACSSKPCHNNASCINTREGTIGDSYECACPTQFAGKNCSEIIGQCQPHTCLNGNCSNVTPNTFLCECDKDFTASGVEDNKGDFSLQRCQITPSLQAISQCRIRDYAGPPGYRYQTGLFRPHKVQALNLYLNTKILEKLVTA